MKKNCKKEKNKNREAGLHQRNKQKEGEKTENGGSNWIWYNQESMLKLAIYVCTNEGNYQHHNSQTLIESIVKTFIGGFSN